MLSERDCLVRLNDSTRSSFVINLHHAFDCPAKVYFVLDYADGADLRYHIAKKKGFSEEEISRSSSSEFIVSCLLLGLKKVHSMGIIHRDLKTENILFDRRGYVKITDFGIAAFEEDVRSVGRDSGTPGYMAPEVVWNMPHSFAADFFALGIICYELLFQQRPFTSESKKDLQKEFLVSKVKLKQSDLPAGVSATSTFLDLINKLLSRNAAVRLGSRGVKEVMSHGWFEDVNWTDLKKGRVKAPFEPGVVQRSKNPSPKKTLRQSTVARKQTQLQIIARDSRLVS